MTRIIFVRHGEADGNIDRNFHGHYNSNLTENGYVQAGLAADYLKDTPIDVLYSSDLTRTFETAKAISKVKGLPIITCENLREINGGDWENVPWEQLPVQFADSYDKWLHQPHLLQMPNGESMVQFQQRVLSAVEEIVTANQGKNICIVTHGTAIKSMLCRYYGRHLSELPDMKWYDNASISIVDFDDELKPTVVLEGEASHLGETSTLAKQSWWRKKLIEGAEE